MPVEIREIIIKTEITSSDRSRSDRSREKELGNMKKQLLEACRIMIAQENNRKQNHKR